MRLVNMHTAPMDAGFAKHSLVMPGQVGEFNGENPSVKRWIQNRLLMSEGEILASRASGLTGPTTAADVALLRKELADKEIVIEDLRQRDAAMRADVKRIEERFSEMAASHGDTSGGMRAQFDMSWKSREEQFAKQISDMETAHASALAAAQAHIAELEATLTAPPAPAGEPKTEGGKATRKG